jgi:nicotinamidase-related amidase
MSATPATSWPGPVDEHIAPRLATSALLIIDTQVDFVDGGRSPIAGTTAVIPKLVELRSAFLDAGRPVIHVVRLYAGDDVDRVRRTAKASPDDSDRRRRAVARSGYRLFTVNDWESAGKH